MNVGDTDITTYTWDHRNRLTKVSHFTTYANYQAGTTDKTVEYTYDYADRRIQRKLDADGSGSGLPNYFYNVYQGDNAALEIHDANGLATGGTTGSQNIPHVAHRYLYGQATDAILASDDGANVLWGLADHEGTIRDIVKYNTTTQVTDVVDHRKYDSFGKMTSESAPATDFIFGYTGQALDKDVGLLDYGHRWYDASVGRFASEDPSGFDAGDMNLYRYVGNNPLNNTDPSGLCNKSNYGFSRYLNNTSGLSAAYQPSSVSYLPTISSGMGSPAVTQFANPSLGSITYQSPGNSPIAAYFAKTDAATLQANREAYERRLLQPTVQADTKTAHETNQGKLQFMAGNSNLTSYERAAAVDQYLDSNYAANTSPVENAIYQTFKSGGGLDTALHAMAGLTPGGMPGIPRGSMPELTKYTNKNKDSAVSDYGIYEIKVNGEVNKFGKADMERVTESSGMPTRLHQQVRVLSEQYGQQAVEYRIVEPLGRTTTKEAKAIETFYLQDYYDQTGRIPLGNEKSFKPQQWK